MLHSRVLCGKGEVKCRNVLLYEGDVEYSNVSLCKGKVWLSGA